MNKNYHLFTRATVISKKQFYLLWISLLERLVVCRNRTRVLMATPAAKKVPTIINSLTSMTLYCVAHCLTAGIQLTV